VKRQVLLSHKSNTPDQLISKDFKASDECVRLEKKRVCSVRGPGPGLGPGQDLGWWGPLGL